MHLAFGRDAHSFPLISIKTALTLLPSGICNFDVQHLTDNDRVWSEIKPLALEHQLGNVLNNMPRRKMAEMPI